MRHRHPNSAAEANSGERFTTPPEHYVLPCFAIDTASSRYTPRCTKPLPPPFRFTGTRLRREHAVARSTQPYSGDA